MTDTSEERKTAVLPGNSVLSMAVSSTTLLADRYRVIERIGRGGMGEVFLAEHAVIGKKVAIKILRAEFIDREDIIQRFLQEARSASDIRHDHIVDITDFGHSPSGRPFFVMEYLEGENLCDTLKEGGAMGWQRARHIAVQICRALQAAHDKGVIHRDVKPGNCLRITKNGDPDFIKVLDFGIAKVINDDSTEQDLTETGMVMGTARYMSPEQAQSLPLDARTDIYSVGIILYQMITGRVPFNDGGFLSIISKQVNASPPTFADVSEGLDAPAGIEAVVMRALAKDPEDRFPTVGEMGDALEAVLEAELVVPAGPEEAVEEAAVQEEEAEAEATVMPAEVAAEVVSETVESRGDRWPLYGALVVLMGLGLWVMLGDDEASSAAAGKEMPGMIAEATNSDKGLQFANLEPNSAVPPGAEDADSGAGSALAAGQTADLGASPGDDVPSDGGKDKPTADVDANSGSTSTGKSTGKSADKITKNNTNQPQGQKRTRTAAKGKAKKKTNPEKASAEVPEKLAGADLRAVLAKIDVAKCSHLGALPGMKVKVKLMISAAGKVVSAEALKPFKGVALGRCVATAAKSASFAKAEKGQVYTHAFKL